MSAGSSSRDFIKRFVTKQLRSACRCHPEPESQCCRYRKDKKQAFPKLGMPCPFLNIRTARRARHTLFFPVFHPGQRTYGQIYQKNEQKRTACRAEEIEHPAKAQHGADKRSLYGKIYTDNKAVYRPQYIINSVSAIPHHTPIYPAFR